MRTLEEKIQYLNSVPEGDQPWERTNAILGQIFTWVQDEEITYAEFRHLIWRYENKKF